jgi:Fic family protein
MMFNLTLLTQLDALKARLDRLRPLAPDLVENLREVYNIRLTYHSNAIAKGRFSTNEGNTLTQSETQIVIEKGITIGGKPLKDHLEAINHVKAIDFIRDLAMDKRAISVCLDLGIRLLLDDNDIGYSLSCCKIILLANYLNAKRATKAVESPSVSTRVI